jgi:hypothetical protein
VQGHAGADWVIYLRRADGHFTQVGSVSTKANRFRVAKLKNGLRAESCFSTAS